MGTNRPVFDIHKFNRRTELGRKLPEDFKEGEREELDRLNKEIQEFSKANPDWQAGYQPFTTSLGDLIKAKIKIGS